MDNQPAELARVQQRLGEFERLYQHMRGRAPAMRKYPATIWPQYERAMRNAAAARTRVQQMAGLADDGYHYAQAMVGREAAQDGLGFLLNPWTLRIGLAAGAWLGGKALELVRIDKLQQRQDDILARNPGMSEQEAHELARSSLVTIDFDNNLSSIAKWAVVGLGVWYLIKIHNTKSSARERSRRDYLKRYG